MVTLPQRSGARTVRDTAPAPGAIGTSNLPGPEAFGAVGAAVLEQNAKVMRGLAQDELKELERRHRLQLTEQLADFEIESIQRPEQIFQEADPNEPFVDLVMQDFEQRAEELTQKQPEYLRDVASAGLLQQQVRVAKSAISLQKRETRAIESRGIETVVAELEEKMAFGSNADIELAQQNLNNFRSTLSADGQAELDKRLGGAQAILIKSKAAKYERPEQYEALARALEEGREGIADRLSVSQRQALGFQMDRAAFTLRQESAKALFDFSRNLVDDPGGAAIEVAPHVLDPDTLDQSFDPILSNIDAAIENRPDDAENLRRVRDDFLMNRQRVREVVDEFSDLPRRERHLAIQRAVNQDRDLMDAVFDLRNVAPESRVYISGRERSQALSTLKDSISERDVEATRQTFRSIVSKFEERGLTQEEVVRGLTEGDDGNPFAFSLAIELMDAEEREGRVNTAALESAFQIIEDPNAANTAIEGLQTSVSRAQFGDAFGAAADDFLLDQAQLMVRNGVRQNEITERLNVMSEIMALGTAREAAALGKGLRVSNIEPLAKRVVKSFKESFGQSQTVLGGNNAVTLDANLVNARVPDVLDKLSDILATSRDFRDRMVIEGDVTVLPQVEGNAFERTARALSNRNDVQFDRRTSGDLSGLQTDVIRNQMGWIMAPNKKDLMLSVRSENGLVQPLLYRDSKGVERPVVLKRDKLNRLGGFIPQGKSRIQNPEDAARFLSRGLFE